MSYQATHRYARISERKARLVVGLIRGRRCDDALSILKFTPTRASHMVARVLNSAIANANEQEANMSRLFVAEAFVNAGPIIKRFQPKDRGRAHPIHKRTCHITVLVDER
ncbi:MAG: 50S ribosomal protein L22 [Phycisphaerae bacterium]|nr:50S ribosomal protein L22 [Phycisphaerae bacterium]